MAIANHLTLWERRPRRDLNIRAIDRVVGDAPTILPTIKPIPTQTIQSCTGLGGFLSVSFGFYFGGQNRLPIIKLRGRGNDTPARGYDVLQFSNLRLQLIMNNDQLKHIVTVLHAIAVGQFDVFGYTGLISETVQ